jgi:predicted enzyme related to lactoylglutathione lyase
MGNPVVHFEVHGKNGAKSQQFHAALFDWQINADNPMAYGMVAADGVGIGGGITTAQDFEPFVTVYVEVADLAAALTKAESLGGKTVMPPMDVPGGPSIAMFSDPDGNVIGLLRAGSMG